MRTTTCLNRLILKHQRHPPVACLQSPPPHDLTPPAPHQVRVHKRRLQIRIVKHSMLTGDTVFSKRQIRQCEPALQERQCNQAFLLTEGNSESEQSKRKICRSLALFFSFFSVERSSLAAQQYERRAHPVSSVDGQLDLGAAAAPGLRGATAQQAEALPHHPAAVRIRHLPGNRRTRAQPRPGTGGAYLRDTWCEFQSR